MEIEWKKGLKKLEEKERLEKLREDARSTKSDAEVIVTAELENEDMEQRYLSVFYNDVIMDKVFSKMDPSDLLNCRQVCRLWKLLANFHIRRKNSGTLLLTDPRIGKFMETMENCDNLPCSKFVMDLFCANNKNVAAFASKYGSFAREYEIMCCIRYQSDRGDSYEDKQIRKSRSIDHNLGTLLANSENIRSLKLRTRYEVCIKPENLEKLPAEFPHLEYLKVECTFPSLNRQHNDVDLLSVLIQRSPHLKKLHIQFCTDDAFCEEHEFSHRYAEQAHYFNEKLPTIIKELRGDPELSLRTMFTGKDCDMMEKLANIPVRLVKLTVQNHIRTSTPLPSQERFLRWFNTWLSRCEDTLVMLGMSVDGSEYMKVPPLKNLKYFNAHFNIVRHQPEIEIKPFITNQFPELRAIALFSFDPRQWTASDQLACVFPSVRGLEVVCQGVSPALPALWLHIFPNVRDLTLRTPQHLQLALVLSEFTQLESLHIHNMGEAEGLNLEQGPLRWIWNLLTNMPRVGRESEVEILSLDPAAEPQPVTPEHPSLSKLTDLKCMTITDSSKDVIHAILYLTRTGRIPKLQLLCLHAPKDYISPDGLAVLKAYHEHACFHAFDDGMHGHYEDYASW